MCFCSQVWNCGTGNLAHLCHRFPDVSGRTGVRPERKKVHSARLVLQASHPPSHAMLCQVCVSLGHVPACEKKVHFPFGSAHVPRRNIAREGAVWRLGMACAVSDECTFFSLGTGTHTGALARLRHKVAPKMVLKTCES